MTKKEVETKCNKKQQELLDKYFGNLVHEAAVIRPEIVGNYTIDLPKKIENEYYEFLRELWVEFNTDSSRRFEDVMNHHNISELATEDDIEGLISAYNDANRRTIWERITQSNNVDVTYYKGLLMVYTKELLSYMRCDFLEDI